MECGGKRGEGRVQMPTVAESSSLSGLVAVLHVLTLHVPVLHAEVHYELLSTCRV